MAVQRLTTPSSFPLTRYTRNSWSPTRRRPLWVGCLSRTRSRLCESFRSIKVWPTTGIGLPQRRHGRGATDPSRRASSFQARADGSGAPVLQRAVPQWLNEGGADVARAAAIETVVRDHLQMVVIDLAADENAFAIFETLNARGAQLTAADPIKNFIFQRLLEAGVTSSNPTNATGRTSKRHSGGRGREEIRQPIPPSPGTIG